MEVEKQAFSGLMEYYKKLPIDDKKSEIIDQVEKIISDYSNICTKLGVMPNMMLNKEMLNISRKSLTEDEFLEALFAYLNTLEDISSQFINGICDKLEN